MDIKPKKNWFVRHKILTILFAILVLGIIGGVASSSLNSKSSTNNQDNSASNNFLPSETPAKETTPPPPPPAPNVYTGSGDDVVTIVKPVDGSAILTFSCPACSHNVSVTTNGAESLLVNTIGAYTSGKHLIDTREGSVTSEVTITATGKWTLSVGGMDQATQQTAGQPVSGKGDDVVHIIGNTSKATITNTGEGNFVINAFPANGGFSDLAVNTIGSYQGTVPLDAPSYVQVNSEGSWSITPK